MLLKGRLDSVTGTKIITEDLVIWGETWSVVYNGESMQSIKKAIDMLANSLEI